MKYLKHSAGAILAVMVFFVGISAQGAALTSNEVAQIEAEFGITLTAQEKTDLAAVVKPDAPLLQWRTDADARIDLNRKADLDVQVVDSQGTPVPDAQVAITLNNNAFKFGGTFSARDFVGDTLPATMTTNTYSDRLLSMFNAVGLNNGFKPRLTNIHQYVPDVLSWAQANDLPVRGHLLMWPGIGDLADLDDPTAVIGTDYGTHLSSDSTSAYASYDVRSAVETYKASSRLQADKDALKAVVDAEIAEWAGRWNVYEWDVINETLGNHLLQDIMGEDQMAAWFNIAASNVVYSDTKLLINDYQIISAMSEARTPGYYTDRRDDYMTNIDQVISDGGQLDRIGFQSRIKLERRDPQLIYDRLEEWGNTYGLEMVGTEFEVKDSDPGDWKEYIYTDEERAQITEEMMTQYYSHPLVTGFFGWDTIDAENKALIDYNGNPNRNGLVWYYMHRIAYSTDETQTSDAQGGTVVRGFKGDYDIVVTYEGTDYTATLTLSSNQTQVVTLGDVVLNPHNQSFAPMEDTYVDQVLATSTAGGSAIDLLLEGKSGKVKEAYLKFTVSDLDGTTGDATLRVYSTSIGETVDFYSVADTNWSEDTMTWNTKPALGALISSKTATAGAWVELDISSLVTGDGIYCFAIMRPGTAVNSRGFSSKEGANPSQLVVFENSAPVFDSDPVLKPAATSDLAYADSIATNAVDAHDDPLIFTALSGPAWLTVATNGLLTGTPLTADEGTNTWSVQVMDDYAAASTATVQIVVYIPNDPPVWNSSPFNQSAAKQDQLYSSWINWRASDPDSDPLTFASVSGPTWLSVALNGNLTGTPADTDAGTNTFVVSVSDGIASAVEATMLLYVEAPPVLDPTPVWTALEEWTFTGGANGAAVGTVASSTGTGSALGGAVANGQDIQGEQARIYGAGTGAAFKSFTHSSYAGATAGVFEVAFEITAADMTLTAAASESAQAGFGIRFNDGSNHDLRALFRFDTDEFLISLSTAEGNETIAIETATILSVSLNVRQVLDMDAGTYTVYYALGAAAEVTAYTGGVFVGQTLGELRQQWQPINGGNGMVPGDTIYMDNITLSKQTGGAIAPQAYYDGWLWYYPGVGSFTDLADNPDGDNLDNLGEYALGGDPANGADVGYVPDFQILEIGGTNYFEYVHAKRNDAAARGLTYSLELSSNLVSSVWTNGNSEVVGIGTVDAEFDSVTNRVPVVGEEGFIRLRIEMQ